MIDPRLTDLAGFIRNAMQDDDQLEIAKDFVLQAETFGAVTSERAERLQEALFAARIANFSAVIDNIERYVTGQKIVLPATYYTPDGGELETEE